MPAVVFAVKAFAQYSFFIYAQLLHHALGGGVFGAALGFDAVKAIKYSMAARAASAAYSLP